MTQITDALCSGLQQLVETTRLSINDPSDQIRLLAQLASYAASAPPSITATGIAVQTVTQATAALGRRAALASLANACAAYQPQSTDDANTVLQTVIPLMDVEIENCGDTGDQQSFTSLRALKAAVINDLQTRGAQLPQVTTTYGNQPARVIAYRLYGDATREDEIVSRNNDTPFPGCMPLTISVLSR